MELFRNELGSSFYEDSVRGCIKSSIFGHPELVSGSEPFDYQANKILKLIIPYGHEIVQNDCLFDF